MGLTEAQLVCHLCVPVFHFFPKSFAPPHIQNFSIEKIHTKMSVHVPLNIHVFLYIFNENTRTDTEF